MKVLVCTDGSASSQKTLLQASIIAEGCNVIEVAIIHVYDGKEDLSPFFIHTGKQEELVKRVKEEYQERRRDILDNAAKIFKEKNIRTRTILKEGHPAHTIINVASEEGFNMIVIGSRGLGGLEKLLLGSVSNAVVQEAKNCNVVIVK